jgi:hypothetical protein
MVSYVLSVRGCRYAVCRRRRGRRVGARPENELVGTRRRERAGLEPLREERGHLQPPLRPSPVNARSMLITQKERTEWSKPFVQFPAVGGTSPSECGELR